MNYKSEQLTMSDGQKVVWHQWTPDGEVKACLLLSHGMVEHATRYERFAKRLTDKGFAFYAEDHRGHGETGKLAEQEGTGMMAHLADKDGFFRVVDDIHEEALRLREMYPNKKLFLLGHSFGSFVTQCFIEKYGECLDGVIICGSAGPRLAMTRTAKVIGKIIKFFTGKHHYSKFIDNVSFGSYLAKIDDKWSDKAWLSRDKNEVQKYIDDPLCGMVCTTSFYCDMFTGLCWIHTKKHMKMIPTKLPVFIIAGAEDPVGNYGKSVTDLYNIYKNNGIADLNMKLYDGARHELFNELQHEEVETDVINFIEKHL